MADVPVCPVITAEIGPNNFFTPKSVSLTRTRTASGNTATIVVELPTNQTVPSPPQIAVVVSSDRTKQIFAGLYNSEAIAFKDNGLTREYSLTLTDFYPFTHRTPIVSYNETLIVKDHVARLMQRANVLNSQPMVNMLDFAVFSMPNMDIMFNPDADKINLQFDQAYLDEAFNMLANIAGYSWEVRAHNFLRVGLLGGPGGIGNALATVFFRQNGLVASVPPFPTLTVPLVDGMICFDQTFFETLNIKAVGPTVDVVMVLGKNGHPPPTNPDEPDLTSVPETTLRQISPGSMQTEYQYPNTVTKVTAAVLRPLPI